MGAGGVLRQLIMDLEITRVQLRPIPKLLSWSPTTQYSSKESKTPRLSSAHEKLTWSAQEFIWPKQSQQKDLSHQCHNQLSTVMNLCSLLNCSKFCHCGRGSEPRGAGWTDQEPQV